MWIRPDGVEGDAGLDCHYVPAPFRFCLHCGISYGSWQSLDFPKLASLGTEGRSSATTVLSLTAIRYLREDTSLHTRPQALELYGQPSGCLSTSGASSCAVSPQTLPVTSSW
jgi:hypothetical protein